MSIRRLTSALLLLALIVSPALGQEKIKFTKAMVTKGTVMNVAKSTTNKTSQVVTIPGQAPRTMSTDAQGKEIKVITILAVGEKGVTKAKMTYKKDSSSTKMNQGGQERESSDESPLEGNTYLVTLVDGAVKATTVDGEEVPEKEMEALRKDLKSKVERGTLVDPFKKIGTLIGEREVLIGETIKISGEDANKIFGDEDSGKNLSGITMTLKGKKNFLGVECAVFDVKLELDMSRMKAQGLDITSDIRGEFLIGINNLWAYKADVKGPIKGNGTVKAPQGEIGVVIDGTVSMSAMAAFTLPKKK